MRIISGMHRSGTSLMGQLLHAVGIDMGTPDTFFPADRWNPDGYYEQRDIIRVNKALVRGPFWKFAYFRLPSTETILEARPTTRRVDPGGGAEIQRQRPSRTRASACAGVAPIRAAHHSEALNRVVWYLAACGGSE
ncbi:MAG: hypothetical protein M5R40_17055 [Anaerolineae bacterium]|nr:hypothetical protein [Anaerolineae bacterium]